MLHLRVYGPSDALTKVGEGLEDRGTAGRVALSHGVRAGQVLLTAEVHSDAADDVLEFLVSRGVAEDDIRLVRFDEVGPIRAGRAAVSLIWAACWGGPR
jgi:hypothetical protein